LRSGDTALVNDVRQLESGRRIALERLRRELAEHDPQRGARDAVLGRDPWAARAGGVARRQRERVGRL